MAKRVSVDGWMFTVTLLLVFVGLVMVFSASAVMAKERYGSAYFFLLRQMGWAVVGIIAMVIAMKVDYRRYKHPAVVFSLLPDVDFGVLSRPLPQYTSLDSFWGMLFSALGNSQARHHFISGLLFGEPNQVHWRLAEYAIAGYRSHIVFSRTYCL
jgi:Cell cycle protein